MENDSETLVFQGTPQAGILGQVGMLWDLGKAPLIVPLLKLMVNVCLAMSVMLFLERLYMGVVKLFIKLLRRKPETKFKWEAMKEDLELGNSAYPMVLVQIPMYNEKEVSLINLSLLPYRVNIVYVLFRFFFDFLMSFCYLE